MFATSSPKTGDSSYLIYSLGTFFPSPLIIYFGVCDSSFDISKFIQSIYPCIAHEELNICKDTTTKVSKWLLTTEYL